MTNPAYSDAVAAFRLEEIAAVFHGNLETGINACVECCDRWADDPTRIALEWESEDGRQATYTFAQLRDFSAQFADLLASRGVTAGDVVAAMLPRTSELLIVILGVWRCAAVYQPLFTAFGPKAVEHRLLKSGAKLVVIDSTNRPKLDDINGLPPVAVVSRINGDQAIRACDIAFHDELACHGTTFVPVMRRADDLILMIFTSGTTGPAKGVPVPIKALRNIYIYMKDAVDLRSEDIYWNIADPGWAYGLYFTITGPLMMGHATILYDGPFTAYDTYRMIQRHGVTKLAGSPTAFRFLIAAGREAAMTIKGRLRAVSSAGELLNPEVIRWFDEHLAAPIRDHYGQTELAMVINNHHGLQHEVLSGSAGLPMRGFRMAVIDDEANELPPNEPGMLAVDIARSPLMWFTGYWQHPTPAIADGYYRTGDIVESEPNGHISFVGRADDVITSSGYRIGPFDVESALIEHPAVLEAAVIGKPDPERTEIVKAFVVPRHGFTAGDDLAQELSQFVKKRLSAHAYPREIEFLEELPKTPSGKIQRFILRNIEAAKVARPAYWNRHHSDGNPVGTQRRGGDLHQAVSRLAKASPAGGIWRMMRVFQVESAWSDEKETTT